jgi:hypothetical protein
LGDNSPNLVALLGGVLQRDPNLESIVLQLQRASNYFENLYA